jgi:hypothetical protein
MQNLYAYDAGFKDGRNWPDGDTSGDVEYHSVTIALMGASAFGVRCGLMDGEVVRRGEGWTAACKDYDRGCSDGFRAR